MTDRLLTWACSIPQSGATLKTLAISKEDTGHGASTCTIFCCALSSDRKSVPHLGRVIIYASRRFINCCSSKVAGYASNQAPRGSSNHMSHSFGRGQFAALLTSRKGTDLMVDMTRTWRFHASFPRRMLCLFDSSATEKMEGASTLRVS